jgi:hypothetical protein
MQHTALEKRSWDGGQCYGEAQQNRKLLSEQYNYTTNPIQPQNISTSTVKIGKNNYKQ